MDEAGAPDAVLEAARLGRYLRSSAGIVAVGEVSYRIGTFLVLLVLARGMPPTDYGSVVIYFTVLTLGGTIAQFGLPHAAVRLVAARSASGHVAAVRAAWTTWGIGVLVAAVLYPLGAYVLLPILFRDFVHDPHLARMAPLVAAGIVFEGFQFTVAEIFRGFHRVVFAVAFGFAGRAVVVLGGVIALRIGGVLTIHGVVLLYAIAVSTMWLLGSLVMLVMFRASGHADVRSQNLALTDHWRAVIALALPILIIALANRLLVQGDTLVVGHLASRVETATYNLASRVCNLLFVPYVVGSLVLAPAISGLWARGERDRLEQVVRAAAGLAVVVTVPCAAVAAAVGGPAIGLVFGHNYSGAGVLLALLSIGPVAAATTAGAGVVLNSSGHQTAAMIGSVVVTVATIGLEFVLGFAAHARGVAIGSAIGSVVQAAVMAQLAWSRVGVRTWPAAGFSGALGAVRRSS